VNKVKDREAKIDARTERYRNIMWKFRKEENMAEDSSLKKESLVPFSAVNFREQNVCCKQTQHY
jgi:hypothetical protein